MRALHDRKIGKRNKQTKKQRGGEEEEVHHTMYNTLLIYINMNPL